MPKSKNHRKKKRSRKKGESHPTGRARPVGPGPLKSMAIGGAIMLLLAAFFFWRVGGDTPFNHVLKALGLVEDEVEESAPQESADPSAADRSKSQAANSGARPDPSDGRPMEKVSTADQKRLDDLINDLK